MKFELWYPAKPYVITQSWGIYNPAYNQFGFSLHNGVDFLLGADKTLYAPCDMKVVSTGNLPTGAGIYLIARTITPYQFDSGEHYVEITFMHCEKLLAKEGDLLEVGTPLAIADNTGFSTGPHTHMRCRKINSDGTLVEQNDANGSFDHAPYFNGYHAQLGKLARLVIQLGNLIVSSLKK